MFVNKQKTKNKISRMQGKKGSNAKYPNIELPFLPIKICTY